MTRNDILNRLPMVAFNIKIESRQAIRSDRPEQVTCFFCAQAIINSTLIEGRSEPFTAWILPGEDEPTIGSREWSLMAEAALEDLHEQVPPRINLRSHIEDLLNATRGAA